MKCLNNCLEEMPKGLRKMFLTFSVSLRFCKIRTSYRFLKLEEFGDLKF